MVAFQLTVRQSKDDEIIMECLLTNSLHIDSEQVNLHALIAQFRQHVRVWLKVAGVTNNNQLVNQNMLSIL